MDKRCDTCRFCEPYDQFDSQPMCARGKDRHSAGFAREYLCKGQYWEGKP